MTNPYKGNEDKANEAGAGKAGTDPSELAADSPTAKQDRTDDGDADSRREGARELVTDAEREQFARESQALPGQPIVREAEGVEAGFTGQVPAQPENDAYTFPGSDEAAMADRKASNPRIFREDPNAGGE
jgi:hypothetical protein